MSPWTRRGGWSIPRSISRSWPCPTRRSCRPSAPSLRPEGEARHRVLVLHGEIEGKLPTERHTVEYGGALVGLRELGLEEWSYVALGHYHVQHEVAPNAWYAGSLEYVGLNIWGELADEAEQGIRGKGWLLADLERGTRHTGSRSPRPARSSTWSPCAAKGSAPEAIDKLIEERLRAIPGGVADRIVRLRVYDVPRHVARELDHAAIRALQVRGAAPQSRYPPARDPSHRRASALPGRRQTLARAGSRLPQRPAAARRARP